MKFRKIVGVLMIGSLGLACNSSLPRISGVSTMGVSHVLPEPGSVFSESQSIAVTFTEQLDPASVSAKSFFVVQGDWQETEFPSSREVERALQEGLLVPLTGDYQNIDGQTWSWAPRVPYGAGQVYTLILTPRLMSKRHFPLTQDLRRGSRPLCFQFYSPTALQSDEFAEEDVNDNALPTPSVPVVSEPEPSAPVSAKLIVSELYYDHDGEEGDGYLFIELFGTARTNIAAVQIALVNGADGERDKTIVLPADAETDANGFYVIADTKVGIETESQVAEADWLVNFDPQNGPDSLQLFAQDGSWLDGLGYGEGLAALALDGTALYEQSPADDAPAGKSVCRPSLLDTDHNQVDFGICIPTPGRANVAEEIATDPVDHAAEPDAAAEPISDSPETDLSSSEEAPEQVPDTSAAPGDTEAKRVVITEAITDPQQDWNDSAGGNGIPFDDIVGTGTVGTTDEWIELWNTSEEAIDLQGWTLVMEDSTVETHRFLEADSLVYFASESTVSEWLPDDGLILGNPEGDLRNELTLRLNDAAGNLIDEWGIGDGNADSIENESTQRSFDGATWIEERGSASPFEF